MPVTVYSYSAYNFIPSLFSTITHVNVYSKATWTTNRNKTIKGINSVPLKSMKWLCQWLLGDWIRSCTWNPSSSDARISLFMNAVRTQTAIRNRITFIIAYHWALVWVTEYSWLCSATPPTPGDFRCCCRDAQLTSLKRHKALRSTSNAHRQVTSCVEFSSKLCTSHKC